MERITKKYVVTFVFLISICYSFAQVDSTSNETIEQKSYRLYTEQKWNELIKFSRNNIDKGYDYFYIQLRIGIAYYEKKNYSLAQNHFKKALTYNSEDELCQEYLYYCYIFTGQNEQARRLSKSFNKELLIKIGIDKQSQVDFLIIEGGSKISDSVTYYNVAKKNQSNYFNPAVYVHIGLNHYFRNKVSFFHAVTFYNQLNYINKINQTQYYLKATIPLKNNWLISPSIHIAHLKSSVDYTITPTQNTPPGAPPRKIVNTISTLSNFVVGSFSITKNINKSSISIGSTFSNMNNTNFISHSGSIVYSVLGNSKIVIGLTDFIHTTNNYTTINNSISPFIYLQPLKRVSIKLSYLLNNGNNIIEENGYLLNNSIDYTISRYGILANYTINKHLSLYGLYQLEFKKENAQLFDYKYNIVIGGLKVSF